MGRLMRTLKFDREGPDRCGLRERAASSTCWQARANISQPAPFTKVTVHFVVYTAHWTPSDPLSSTQHSPTRTTGTEILHKCPPIPLSPRAHWHRNTLLVSTSRLRSSLLALLPSSCNGFLLPLQSALLWEDTRSSATVRP